jgi:hypothetical protein
MLKGLDCGKDTVYKRRKHWIYSSGYRNEERERNSTGAVLKNLLTA